MPSLEQKVLDFRTVAAKSWKTIYNCVHVLEDQVMEEIRYPDKSWSLE